jgi:transposase-like protein
MEAQTREPRRYGTELKQEIARYGLARRAEGASNRVIASELGLSVAVVAIWLRHAERRKQAGKPPFERILPVVKLHDASLHDAPVSRGTSKHQ